MLVFYLFVKKVKNRKFCPLSGFLFVKNHYLQIAQFLAKAMGISE